MSRRSLFALVCTVLVSLAIGELEACGDKFLRPGRSARNQAYAAIYPADILLYVPNATPAHISQYESTLKGAGHRPRVVRTVEALRAALAASAFDLVIAPLADAPPLKASAAAVQSKPNVLPIVAKPTKAAWAAIEREYRHALKAGVHARETLAEIDHVMEERVGPSPASAARR